VTPINTKIILKGRSPYYTIKGFFGELRWILCGKAWFSQMPYPDKALTGMCFRGKIVHEDLKFPEVNGAIKWKKE